ncbi:glycosyltransferase family 2 protein [Microbaculum marinum]|uniref:Glycosyltransferase family 2 protein n=1 Tax=Microbaculum marinum TaxID=1764581 RepID=A0AAW9S4B9_9HYPH
MASPPRVTIVLLNWNGGTRVVECYRAARAQTGADVEVILVDNASEDGSLELCLAEGEPDRLVRLPRNVGFAAGMNAGIAEAAGEWVMPLGNDVWLPPDYVATVVARGDRDPEIGVVGGAEYAWVDGERTDIPRPSAGAFFLTRELRGRWVRRDEDTYAFGVSGSMPLMRRAMLDDLHAVHGYWYDERFGTGYEDLDLWFRMQHRGWKALFCPSARAWHVGSASAAGASGFLDKAPDYQRRLFRNRRLIWMKNVSPGMRRRLGLRWRAFELLLPVYLALRSPRALGPWWSGTRDAGRMSAEIGEEAARARAAGLVPDETLLGYIR